MMKNISCFNVSEKPEREALRASQTLKQRNVFHHPVKAKI